MNPDATIDQLLSEALRSVPDELRADIRNWIARARSGELTELSRELQRDADAAWRMFNSAADVVENKL
jgi:hypothetical protein